MWTAPTMCMNLLPLYRGLALTLCFRSSWSRTQIRAPFLSFLLRSRLSLSVSTSFVIVPQISDSQSKQNRKRNQDLEKKIWKAFLMFGVPLHPCRLSLSISASLPLGFRWVALLFSTISAGNRLLSVCTRLLIQELVCTDDGTPFTMLIKVAAARSRRETEQGSEENEREREGGREVVSLEEEGWIGGSIEVINTSLQTGANYGQSKLCCKTERGERGRESPSITGCQREGWQKQVGDSQPATKHPSSARTVFIIVLSYTVK